jgi:hypothetical protein
MWLGFADAQALFLMDMAFCDGRLSFSRGALANVEKNRH